MGLIQQIYDRNDINHSGEAEKFRIPYMQYHGIPRNSEKILFSELRGN
jgi:hypothetical protein